MRCKLYYLYSFTLAKENDTRNLYYSKWPRVLYLLLRSALFLRRICENKSLGQQCVIRLFLRFWKTNCLDMLEDNWGSTWIEKYLSLLSGKSLSHLVSFTLNISSYQNGQGEWWEEKIDLFVQQEDLSWCLGCSQIHKPWGDLPLIFS